MATKYDAFLSYNSKDCDTAAAIANYLKEKVGLKLFFDQWEMIPGTPVQEALEKALDESDTCVVFIGPSGLSNYQNEETRIALEKSIAKKNIRVIPVLLPGGKRETKESQLPPFLRRLNWVEFGDDPLDPKALHRLVCGIKNITPGTGDKPSVTTDNICPYRGLEVFREQDRHLFFGREALVQRLMTRLKSGRFLALIGPSGSGKSSVLQAGLIPLLRPGSLIALFTPRERPLEELAFALRKAAAPVQIQYSTTQIIDQLNQSPENLHYLAREILQAQPVDSSKPLQRFVIIVDQLEEIFTLTPLEENRRKFINLLLRAVEIAGGPVTVVLAMRSDFIGKCAPYRDLNIYFSEHLDQVEPMTPVELQAAIENPAKSVGFEFDEGLVEVMLNDVKGSGSELPLIGHALWELYHYQPRPANRLTAQAYEAISRIEGALVRRAETLYNELTVPEQETLRKMFLLGLIQPGEGAPDTRRRAIKEELVVIGGDAAAAEQLLYQLATARLLTIAHDEASGQDTVEVAHEALIRNWGRIEEWMDKGRGREIARQRGILRQVAREWDKNGKNPEYLFRGTRLAQMEEFVSAHGQDLGTLEKEFIAAGTAEREALQRKKRRNIQVIIGALMVVLVVVTFFAYQACRSEKKARRQLAVNYWDAAQRMRKDNDRVKSLHLFCEALGVKKDKRSREVLLADMNGLWKTPPLLNIFANKDGIKGAQFSKDGTSILIWSFDGTTRLWDAANRKPIGDVMKHDKGVNGAIFNKDETCIITWSYDGTVRLWEAATGKPIGEVMKHEDSVRGAIYNKKETRILTWSYDRTTRIWDAATGKPIGDVMKHDKGVNGAIFNKDETYILTWSDDSTARLWDAANGNPIGEVMKHEDDVNGALFNNDDTRILTWSDDGTARLWGATNGNPIGEVMNHVGGVIYAIFILDETRILTFSLNGTYRLWDAETGKQIGDVVKHESSVQGSIFNKDETRILTWSDDKTVRLWDASTGKPIGEVMKHEKAVYGANLNKDGTRIITWNRDYTVRLWNASTGKSIGEVMKHGHYVGGAVFNHNETRILTWSFDGTARLWDAATGKPIGEAMKHEKALDGANFNKDGTRILTWDGYDYRYTVRLWDAVIRNPICLVMKHEASVYGAIYNHDETRILTRSIDGTVRLWHAVTGKPIGEVMKHDDSVWGTIFNKNETRILTWSKDGTARIWEAATGKPIGEVMKHGRTVNGAIFNKDETYILTWSDDGTARLWDAANGNPIGEVMKHEDDVNGALFNNDDTSILTWSDDGTARLWDAATNKPIGEVMKHGDDVNGAIFNKDGARILTWSGDYHRYGTARLWDAETGKPIGEVMKHGDDVNGAIFNKDETRIPTWSGFLVNGTARHWDAATGIPIGAVMKHERQVNGAIFNKNETLILTWSFDGTARLWDAATGKPIGEVMKHGDDVNGAIFNKDETRILTWSDDKTLRLWDIAIDPDFPMEHIKLQVQAITGTSYDTITNTVKVLPPDEWRKIKEDYMKIAAKHYQSCRFPEGNVFRRLFPVEAQKIRPYPPK